MGKALGPLLIISGLFLLEALTLRLPGISLSGKHRNKLVEAGAPGAFLLGFIFALAFCPISAALFFGSLIPLALNSKSGTLLPFIYGIGTGLPVFIFAVAFTLAIILGGRNAADHCARWVRQRPFFEGRQKAESSCLPL